VKWKRKDSISRYGRLIHLANHEDFSLETNTIPAQILHSRESAILLRAFLPESRSYRTNEARLVSRYFMGLYYTNRHHAPPMPISHHLHTTIIPSPPSPQLITRFNKSSIQTIIPPHRPRGYTKTEAIPTVPETTREK